MAEFTVSSDDGSVGRVEPDGAVFEIRCIVKAAPEVSGRRFGELKKALSAEVKHWPELPDGTRMMKMIIPAQITEEQKGNPKAPLTVAIGAVGRNPEDLLNEFAEGKSLQTLLLERLHEAGFSVEGRGA